MRTFRVDEVVAVETRMPLASLELASLLGARVIAKSPSLDRCVAPLQLEPFQGMNGLLLAVHTAFSQHRPLTLSPDDVWLAILQGFALHLRENGESLRQRFVDFTGRATLSVEVHDAENWPENL